MIIDTHCHLDDERYNDDIEQVLENAKQVGVEKFIIPGADPKTLERAVELSEMYEEIYFSVGVHPYDAEHYDRSYLEKFINHPKCVAISYLMIKRIIMLKIRKTLESIVIAGLVLSL